MKDGTCFIPGGLVGTTRKSELVEFIDFLVYDIDGKQSLSEASELLGDYDFLAYIYTSFSHQSAVIYKDVVNYEKWAEKTGQTIKPTNESVRAFLNDNEASHLSNTRLRVDSSDVPVTEEAHGKLCYSIFHDPVDKFRVIIPLKERLFISGLAETHKRSIDVYKSIYHGVGQAIGLHYDKSCEDPSRVYYLPSCMTEHKHLAKAMICNGAGGENVKLLDYDRFPKVDNVSTRKTRDKSKTSSKNRQIIDKNGSPINLMSWIANTDSSFDIEDLLTRTLPEEDLKEDRTAAGGGFHITCPFESGHSTPGGLGTYVVNGDDERGWTIFCAHASCSKIEEYDRLDYLAEFIEQGYITAEDLGLVTAKKAQENIEDTLGLDLGTISVPDSLVNPKDSVEADDNIDVNNVADLTIDESKTTEEIRADCLAIIERADSNMRALPALKCLLAKGGDCDYTVIIDSLARSQLHFSKVKKVVSTWVALAKDLDDAAEMLQFVMDKRKEVSPIEVAISHIYNSMLDDVEVNDELIKVALHYDVKFEIAYEIYKTATAELQRQRYGDEAQEQFDRLTKKFAKLYIGSSLFYLDMERTRERLEPIIRKPQALAVEYRNRSIEMQVEKLDKKTGRMATNYQTTSVLAAWEKTVQDIKTYPNGLTFMPTDEDSIDGAFNMWPIHKPHPWGCDPKEGDVQPILDHILSSWCVGDEKLLNWVLLFFADIFQNPGEKKPCAILLLGPNGTGKSLILKELIGPMLGNMYHKTARREDLVGRFNSGVQNKLLILGEEILFSGDNQGVNRLQDEISSNRTRIEQKGVDAMTIPFHSRFIFTSNDDVPIKLNLTDRRYLVLNSQPDGFTPEERVAHYTKFCKWLADVGKNHFLDYMLKWKPSDYGLRFEDLFTPPITAGKDEVIEASADYNDKFFIGLLRDGRLYGDGKNAEAFTFIRWGLDAELVLEMGELKHAFEAYVEDNTGAHSRFLKGRYQTTFKRFFGERQSNFRRKSQKRYDLDGNYCLVLPTRREALKVARSQGYLTQSMYDEGLDTE